MIFHCFIISKRTITSLMTLFFLHLFHPHKLFLLLQYITPLFALLLHQTIITIILFEDGSYTFFCTYILLLLLLF